MFVYLLQGFLFGLAYVAPIGAQNLYVINTAITKSKWEAFRTALVTIFFDISLGISCFLGVGILLEKIPILRGVVLLFGCIAVIYIGIGLVRSSAKLKEPEIVDGSLIKTIVTCFAVTWLNPQAIIDGSLLLGGFRASMPENMSIYFITGVCLASTIWFNTIVAIVHSLRNKMNRILRWINIVCGSVMIFYGIKLAYSFYLLIKW